MRKILKLLFGKEFRVPLIIILCGLLIRFLLMPASTHLDLLLSSGRQTLLIFKDALVISDPIDFFLSLFMRIFKPLIKDLPALLYTPSYHGDLLKELQALSEHRSGLRYLFLLKFPFLVFDIASLVVVWKLFQKQKQRIIALTFWAFNPLVLYSAYTWGRYELIPIFFALVAVLFAKNYRPFWSMLFLGLAITTRPSYLLFLPFFLIHFSEKPKTYAKYLLVALIPMVISAQLLMLNGGGSMFRDIEQDGFIDYIAKGSLGGSYGGIAPFILIYPAILYLYYREKKAILEKAEQAVKFRYLVTYGIIGALSFFATSFFNPQYLAWLTPLLIPAIVQSKKIIWPLALVILSLIVIGDINFNAFTTTLLFAPLDFNFFYLHAGIRNADMFYGLSSQTVLTTFHSLFILGALVLSLVLYRERVCDEN